MNSLIGDKAFYKRVFKIAFPIVIQNGVTNLVNLLDNMMIGQLGTIAMSGVSIANQLLMIFNVTIFGAMSGPGIFMSQFYGKKDKEGLKSCFQYKMIVGLGIILVASILLSIFGKQLISMYLTSDDPTMINQTLDAGMTYLRIMIFSMFAFAMTQAYGSALRETGNTIVPMIASVIAVVLNTFLNYCLIFGHFGMPKLGIVGGAIATLIARYIEMSVVMIGSYAFHHEDYFRKVFKKINITKDMAIAITKKSLPLLCNEILWSIFMAMIVQCYSTRGIEAVAAMNITTTVTHLFMIVCYALGNSIAIIVGHDLGAGKLDEARINVSRTIFMNVCICLVFLLLLMGASNYIPLIYNTGKDVQHMASTLLKIAAIMIPVQASYNSCYFTLRAGGKTFLTMLFDSGYTVVVSFPVAFILSRFTGLNIYLLYLAVQLFDLPKAIIGLTLIKKGVWVQNIVNEL